jgi:GT2 family glycosyltransferase
MGSNHHIPLVSIILVNWNQPGVTLACLDSLSQVTYPNLEIICVDNGSTDGSANRLAARYPDIQIVRNETNEGFTGGNNVGILRSTGAYVFLLNNDTEVVPGFIEPLVAAMESDPGVGIVSPKIRFFDHPDVLQYAGCVGINKMTVRGELVGFRETDRGQYDQPQDTLLAHGAAMMIRRSLLQEVGLLADWFFIYYEEFDFCERTKRAGYRIRYIPTSLVYHKESVTVGKESPTKSYYMARNRLTFIRRNVSGWRLAVAVTYVTLVAFPVNIVRHALRGRFDLLSSYVRGIAWHIIPRSISSSPSFNSELVQ